MRIVHHWAVCQLLNAVRAQSLNDVWRLQQSYRGLFTRSDIVFLLRVAASVDNDNVFELIMNTAGTILMEEIMISTIFDDMFL